MGKIGRPAIYPDGTKKINLPLPPELRNRLESEASDRGISLTALILEILEAHENDV